MTIASPILTSYVRDEMILFTTCPLPGKLINDGAVFCFNATENVVEARYHTKQDLTSICDETLDHDPKRGCSVYGGSGKYATLVMASKGGTTSTEGIMTLDGTKYFSSAYYAS